jgi:hypothetical protein
MIRTGGTRLPDRAILAILLGVPAKVPRDGWNQRGIATALVGPIHDWVRGTMPRDHLDSRHGGAQRDTA